MPIEKPRRELENLVDSVLLIRTARVAMVFASLVGLPLAGYVLSRIMHTADDLIQSAATTAQKLDLLDQSFRLTSQQRERDQARQDATLTDHELRLRVLERMRPKRAEGSPDVGVEGTGGQPIGRP